MRKIFTLILAFVSAVAYGQSVEKMSGANCVGVDQLWVFNGSYNVLEWIATGATITPSTPDKKLVTIRWSAPRSGAQVSVRYLCGTTQCMTPASTFNVSAAGLTPAVAIAPNTNNICEGTSVTFTATPTNGGSPTYNWRVNGTTVQSGTSATLTRSTFLNGDVVTVVMTSTIPCPTTATATSNAVTMNVTTRQTPTVQIHISGGKKIVCPGVNTQFSVSTQYVSGSNLTRNWFVGSSGIQGQQPLESVFISPPWVWDDKSELRLVIGGITGCVTSSTAIGTLTVRTRTDDVIAGAIENDMRCKNDAPTTQFTISGNSGASYVWSATNVASISSNGLVTWSSDISTTSEIKATPDGCAASAIKRTVKSQAQPPVPSTQTKTICLWESTDLTVPAQNYTTNFAWYDNNNNLLKDHTQYYLVTPRGKVGTYEYRIESINQYGCRSASKGLYTITVVDNCSDDKLNWTKQTSFNGSGLSNSAGIISRSKSYFDFFGRHLQSQSIHNTTGKVFTSQVIADKLDRPILSSLPAPISETTFMYQPDFIVNEGGSIYTHEDFDKPENKTNPNPISSNQPGTLGWYYSANNNLEENVPATKFPYARVDYYNDGSGAARRQATVGEVHRLGQDHDVVSGVFPLVNELNDYHAKKLEVYPFTTTAKRGTMSVMRDVNRQYAVAISDPAGRTVMTARPGTDSDKQLEVNNTVVANVDNQKFVHFCILTPQVVTISGGSFAVEDLLSGAAFQPSGTWPVGFYRVKIMAGTVTIGYKHYFKDIAYSFYNDTGRLLASVSPNGYTQWSTVPFDKRDITTYRYNFRGQVLETRESDAGLTKYKYRSDGAIRFSQNAEQRLHNRFSYTNYDAIGRPKESGEYIGSVSFDALDAQLEYGTTQEKRSWLRTYYDVKDANFQATTGLDAATYAQTYLHNGLSWSENENNQTWYSYNEKGQTTWIARKPKQLKLVFVTKYQYNTLGAVTSVSNYTYNLENTIVNEFHHHYEYDADQRLSKAYTSMEVAGSKKLRATYHYYLHGPLKRIELGDKLQGVDFVYNIHGWLTQINHPLKSKDPGHDTNDAFGMILDYYESEVPNLLSTTAKPKNTLNNHGLTDERMASQSFKQPLPVFTPDVPTVPEGSSLKAFSAENPVYQKMMSATNGSTQN